MLHPKRTETNVVAGAQDPVRFLGHPIRGESGPPDDGRARAPGFWNRHPDSPGRAFVNALVARRNRSAAGGRTSERSPPRPPSGLGTGRVGLYRCRPETHRTQRPPNPAPSTPPTQQAPGRSRRPPCRGGAPCRSTPMSDELPFISHWAPNPVRVVSSVVHSTRSCTSSATSTWNGPCGRCPPIERRPPHQLTLSGQVHCPMRAHSALDHSPSLASGGVAGAHEGSSVPACSRTM